MLWGFSANPEQSVSFQGNPKIKKDFVKSRGIPNVFKQSKKPAPMNEYPVIVNNHLAAQVILMDTSL